ncbi:hypothetical protein KY309_03595 [Candidatus Woesearchaeota archaeon]|nr:hypothetical protein [Candidatus Woesearchaeota archaeon]
MKTLPLILALLLVLAACGTQVKDTTEQTEVQEETPVQETVQEQPVEEQETSNLAEQLKQDVETTVEEETTTPAQQRTKVHKYLDLFAKTTGYEFIYKGDHIYSKGTTYKIQLDVPRTVKNAKFGETTKNLYYYDTVYVDRVAQTAIAYCEGYDSQVNRQCAQLEIYDLAYPVAFGEYNMVLPEDWLFQNLNKEPILVEENKYYIKGRNTIFLKFADGLELSVDPATGIPLRADQKRGNQLLERYEYEDMVANKVRDTDIRHRTKDEIPTTETFYR